MLSNKEMEAIAKGSALALRQIIEAKLKPLEERLEKLESCGLKYMGTFQNALAQDYTRGSVVTHAGSSWIALKDKPSGRPGQNDDYQLLVKGGV